MADVLGGTSPENNSSGRKKIILIVFVFLAIIAIPLTVYIAQKQQEIRQRASTGEPSANAVAQINGQTINKDELEKAKGLFSYLKKTNADDQKVKDEAMNFLIERRLLENEARKRGIFDKASTIANQRIDNLIAQYKDQQEAEKVLNIDMVTYRNYALNEAIKEGLEPIITKWRVVDYLSIRYLWHNAPELEELAFKDVAKDKIQEYYTRIQNGLDIRQAIKERCQDSTINYFPFKEHLKIYETTFDGESCREQRINLKVSEDTNKEWGEKWLTEVFKWHKGQISSIITYDDKAVGIFFIIKVLDEGGGDSLSIDHLVATLKSRNNILIYGN